MSEKASNIHKFGWRLAIHLLGECCVKQLLTPHHWKQETRRCVRSNWRSRLAERRNESKHRFGANDQFEQSKYPKNYRRNVSIDGEEGVDDVGSRSDRNEEKSDICRRVSPETLFVDVTFDFLFHSLCRDNSINEAEIGKVNRRELPYHVISLKDLHLDDNHNAHGEGSLCGVEEVGVSVSVRIGGLLVYPTDMFSDESFGKNDLCSADKGIISGDGESQQNFCSHRYQQSRPLTLPQIHAHCGNINVDPEMSDMGVLADLIGDSFLNFGNIDDYDGDDSGNEGCWKFVAILSDFSQGIDSMKIKSKHRDSYADEQATETKKRWNWFVKLRHDSIQEDGMLALDCQDNHHFQINRRNNASDTRNGLHLGEPIGKYTLEMMINQYYPAAGNRGGNMTLVSLEEARIFWKCTDTAVASLLEPSPTSPKQLQKPHNLSNSDPFVLDHIQNVKPQQHKDGETIDMETTYPPEKKHTRQVTLSADDDDSDSSVVCIGSAATVKEAPKLVTLAEKKSTSDDYHVANKASNHAIKCPKDTNNNNQNSRENNQAPIRYRHFPNSQPMVFAKRRKVSIVGSKRKRAKFTIGDR